LVLRVARTVRVFRDLDSASAALARRVAATAAASVRARDRFSLVISGGRTPLGLFRRWGGAEGPRLPWAKSEVFFADERCVPPNHPDSNFGVAWETFLSRVPIARRRVHRLRGELRPPSEAAARYAREIGPLEGSPRFDLVLLGIGPDGHTASLFPGRPAVREKRRPVVAVPRAGQPPFVRRLTLTPPALSSAREVCFLVAGADKSAALSRIFRSGPQGDLRFPASRVQPPKPAEWFLDRAAAEHLPSTVRR
jgi:6-phosphogluconolactonase